MGNASQQDHTQGPRVAERGEQRLSQLATRTCKLSAPAPAPDQDTGGMAWHGLGWHGKSDSVGWEKGRGGPPVLGGVGRHERGLCTPAKKPAQQPSARTPGSGRARFARPPFGDNHPAASFFSHALRFRKKAPKPPGSPQAVALTPFSGDRQVGGRAGSHGDGCVRVG